MGERLNTRLSTKAPRWHEDLVPKHHGPKPFTDPSIVAWDGRHQLAFSKDNNHYPRLLRNYFNRPRAFVHDPIEPGHWQRLSTHGLDVQATTYVALKDPPTRDVPMLAAVTAGKRPTNSEAAMYTHEQSTRLRTQVDIMKDDPATAETHLQVSQSFSEISVVESRVVH